MFKLTPPYSQPTTPEAIFVRTFIVLYPLNATVMAQAKAALHQSSKIFFLTESHMRRLYKQNVSRTIEPQHITRLQSALDSPQQHFLYNDQRDPFVLAGLLTERIILNHAYGNGNKRSGCVAGDMFLKLNGWKIKENAADMKLRDAYVKLARGDWTAVEFAGFCKRVAEEYHIL